MVEVVHWNPTRRPTHGVLRRLRRSRPVDNFGDLLGPLIVDRLVEQRGLDPAAGRDRRLLAVGSILTMAGPGDTVWGCGVNGKHLDHPHAVDRVSFRAVRGPRTAAYLESLGAEVPRVFGDPGLLVAELWPRPLGAERGGHGVLVAPNLHDHRAVRQADGRILDPTRPVFECLRRIVESDFVIASSLHAVIVADAYGVPARLVASGSEPDFKYRDYLEGTGRFGTRIARDVREARALGPHEPLAWSSSSLLASFPEDLWGR